MPHSYVFIIFIYVIIVTCGIGAIIEIAEDENTPSDIALTRIANMIFFPIVLIIWIPRLFIGCLWLVLKSNFKR